MRISTLFTVASLFLIGSYSLPQPENVEASRTIEDREAKHGPDGPFPSGAAEWWEQHKNGGSGSGSGSGSGPSSTNETKIKERQGPPPGDPFPPPDGMTFKQYMKHNKHKGDSPSQSASVPLGTGTSDGSTTELSSTSGSETNNTKVRMKFRD